MNTKTEFAIQGKRLNHNAFPKGVESQQNCSKSTKPLEHFIRRSFPRRWRYINPRERQEQIQRRTYARVFRWASEDADRLLFLTLGFNRHKTIGEAVLAAQKVVRWFRREVVDSWVRSIETEPRVHIHFLLRLVGELNAASGLELIELEIEEKRCECGICRVHSEPVRHVGKACSYLVKTLAPDAWEVRPRGARVFSTSRNVPRAGGDAHV